jgi:hypothetical protein
MANKTSLTVIQLNDSHAYFDLHQEMFWQGGQSTYRPAGGYARIAAIVKQIRAGDSATSLVMKRVKYNKQEASKKMGWMRFLDLKMLEAEV